jgi:hypothetical protein
MPSSGYFRRQADICLRLSHIASDAAVSSRLVGMATAYFANGEELEKLGRVKVATDTALSPIEQ